MASPDLEHFKKSLWPEFRRWCPWECVVEEHRRMEAESWEPRSAFYILFKAEVGGLARLDCGGMNDPEAWHGPNLNFWHLDEARRFKKADALKVISGRVRIVGPTGTPPQIWLTTTPRKHWLFDYFGPMKDNDPYADFKRDSRVVTIPVWLNISNLDPSYLEARAASLTASEKRVLMDAEWEEETDTDKFVNIIWWDNCQENLPPLRRNEPMVLALDAAKGGATENPDSFAAIGVTRHPHRSSDLAARYCGIWIPPAGGLLDYGPIEEEIRRLCQTFSIIEIAYDPAQLHYLCTKLKREGVANTKEFGQASPRLKADRQLRDLIMSKRIAHDGNPLLRKHVDNADAKKSGEGIRIVKRSESLKVDACVALAMAADRCLYFNLA